MPREKSPGSPTTRRYTESEKDQAVRLVRRLRAELGSDHGTVQRVAKQLGYGIESVRTWVRERDVADGVAGPTRSGSASWSSTPRSLSRSCVRRVERTRS
jgi:transposase